MGMAARLIIKKNLIVLCIVISCALLLMPALVLALNSATPVTRATTDSSGAEANAVTGNAPVMSSDGRFVAFTSSATNLVSGDTNGVDDTFVKDTLTGVTIRVSTDSAGAQSNGASIGSPDISDDGRYVVVNSNATNLVAGDTNGFSDVFVKDTQTGATTRVSTDSLGVQGNNLSFSFWTSISGNGRFVVYLSVATNLVVGDTNGFFDIFVKDTQTGITTRVSTDSLGAQGNNNAVNAGMAISSDGRYVTFISTATNLVAGDTNGFNDIFVKDTQTGTTTRVSTDSTGAQSNSSSQFPTISGSGRYISFDSPATNLVTGDTNAVGDVFVKDTQTGVTTRVSTNDAGVQGSAVSVVAVISPDGRYVAFRSDATNLVINDTNGFRDHFVKDTQTGITARVSTDSTGANGNLAISGGIAISADSQYLAFTSNASNLVAGDTNATSDVFFRQNPMVLFPANDDFTASPVPAGGTTPSVLTNDLRNGSPANPADYTLSIINNGGLSGLIINADGTLTVPATASAGSYTITYQACEVLVPSSCVVATATLTVLAVSTGGSGLAETGTNRLIFLVGGILLMLVSAAILTMFLPSRHRIRSRSQKIKDVRN